MRVLFCYFFAFLSGVFSLIYQTVWVKQLGLVIGIDVYSISLVVGGFFLGLALGSFYFAHFFTKKVKIYRTYSGLEVVVSISAIMVSYFLFLGINPYIKIESVFGPFSLIIYALTFVIPAFFMAGTLISLVKYVEEYHTSTRLQAGYLYSFNIVGAVIGTLATPMLLIPTLGVITSVVWVAIANIMLAILSYYILKSNAEKNNVPPLSLQELLPRKPIVALYALSGFVSIGLELIWMQVVVQYMNTRVFSYAVVLSVFLTGLALGNFSASFIKTSKENAKSLLLVSMLCSILFSILPLLLFTVDINTLQLAIKAWVFDITSNIMFANGASFLFIASYFIFLSTFFFGCTFPLALLSITKTSAQSINTAKLLGANTLAGVVSTVVIGFILLPKIGVIYSIKVLAIIIIVAVLCSLRDAHYKKLISAFATGIFLSLLILPQSTLSDLLVEKEGGQLLWFQEGIGNTVAIIEQGEGSRSFRRLYIQGVSNTGDVMASKRYMRLQTYIPLLIHPGDPKSALVIGLGTGITAGAMSNVDSLVTRDVYELLEEVKEGTRYFEGNYNITTNSLVNIYIGDGRHQLAKTSKMYDMITLEPPPPTASGVANLYSNEFYQLSKSKLNKGGVVAQWWPIATQSVAASQSIVKTMLSNFKYVSLWTTEVHEMLLVGSDDPQNIDYQAIDSKLNKNSRMLASLTEVGISRTEQLMATFVAERASLEIFSHNAPIITDDFPLLEFDDWTNELVITEIMPQLLNMMVFPPNVPDGKVENVKLEQKKLTVFYIASMAAYENQPEIWHRYMGWLLQQEHDNQYFNWFDPSKP